MQRVFLFTLFITVTYAHIIIEHFGARGTTTKPNDKSGIFATHVELEAKFTNCSQCRCYVQTNGTADDRYELTFAGDKLESAPMSISGLTPHTVYVFTLTCNSTEGETVNSKTFTKDITTDSDRPLAPVNLNVVLEYPKLKITWQTPAGSVVPPNAHRITIDGESVDKGQETVYQMPGDYVYGTERKISVLACHRNNQDRMVCSADKGNPTIFKESAPTTISITASTSTSSTTSTTTSTTPKSTGAYSFSLSIPVLIGSLFLVMPRQW